MGIRTDGKQAESGFFVKTGAFVCPLPPENENFEALSGFLRSRRS